MSRDQGMEPLQRDQEPDYYRELLIGCGNRREKILRHTKRPDWENLVTLDVDPNSNPDFLYDLNIRPLPFPENNFNEIHAYEVLEHIGTQGDWRRFLEEFEEYWRILKPGGLLFATVPRWDTLWAWGDPGHTRVINEGTLIFLSQQAYRDQVGKTPMTDYRAWYKGNFHCVHQKNTESGFEFVLEAVK